MRRVPFAMVTSIRSGQLRVGRNEHPDVQETGKHRERALEEVAGVEPL